MLGLIVVVVVLGGIVGCSAFKSSKATTNESRVVSQKATKVISTKSDVNQQTTVHDKLEKAAKATEQPYKISTTDLGGNYIMGVITYYPDDTTKTYMDYSVAAPSKPQAVTDDAKSQQIEYKLKTTLPTINKTITVIDASKVTMATYKQKDDTYNTILMYDGNPFGYVATDKDDNMVNNVTTYYIQKVQKNN